MHSDQQKQVDLPHALNASAIQSMIIKFKAHVTIYDKSDRFRVYFAAYANYNA